jgi:hypothetical protein
MLSPNPIPLDFVVKRGSKIFAFKFDGIPSPLSDTSIMAFLSFWYTETFIEGVSNDFVAWIEFFTRFVMILIRLVLSIITSTTFSFGS